MLRIRLSRVGKKGHPSYRIVVADVAAPRDGAYLEWIGNYDPMADPPLFTIKEDRATHRLNLGAQPSDPVLRILDKNGILERTPRFRNASSAPVSNAAPAAVAEGPAEDPATDEPETNAEDPIEEAPADEDTEPVDEESVVDDAESETPDEEAGEDT